MKIQDVQSSHAVGKKDIKRLASILAPFLYAPALFKFDWFDWSSYVLSHLVNWCSLFVITLYLHVF